MNESDNIPRHVAIIMDGNGRWANNKGRERTFGHENGADSVRAVLKAARKKGVAYLTLYVFSTENWGRPEEEVSLLMELFCKSVTEEMDELRAEGVKVKMIGKRDGMPDSVLRHIDLIEENTKDNELLTVIFAMNYSSRSEITEACRRIAAAAADDRIDPDHISEDTVSRSLFTSSYPDPDLIIRTGGDQRLSNFLLWQGAYSELYFTEMFWPDFGEDEFNAAIAEYARRERRFGLINDENTH